MHKILKYNKEKGCIMEDYKLDTPQSSHRNIHKTTSSLEHHLSDQIPWHSVSAAIKNAPPIVSCV